MSGFEELPPDYEERLAAARTRFLYLDYDGTLAPYRVEREAATPHPDCLEILGAIVATGTFTVAVVSGRPIAQLLELLPLDVTLAGEHGWEERDPGHEIVRHFPDEPTCMALERAHQLAVENGLAAYVERKRTSIVTHVRGIAPAIAGDVLTRALSLWQPFIAAAALRLDRTNHGVELRAIGHDKGSFVRRRLEQAGAGAFAIYIGDDLTDEDAFVAVRHGGAAGGVAVRVGERVDSTVATVHLRDPAMVCRFLAFLHEAVLALKLVQPKARLVS